MNLSIDWFITTKCNDNCKFCYAPLNFNEYDLSLEQYYQICDRIKQLGFKKVTICGGEPTLNIYIVEIVKYLYSLGMEIIFYTNGIQKEIVKEIVNYIEYLSLPVDSINTETKNLRSKEQMIKIIKTLDYLEQFNYKKKCKVKIGTVVNKQNIEELDQIYNVIKNYNIVKHWRLYQFSAAEIGKIYHEIYEVDDEIFETVRKKYLQNMKEGLNISFRSRKDNIGYCVIINQKGEFFRYEEKYIDLEKDIFNSNLDEIIPRFDINKNILQKNWTEN